MLCSIFPRTVGLSSAGGLWPGFRSSIQLVIRPRTFPELLWQGRFFIQVQAVQATGRVLFIPQTGFGAGHPAIFVGPETMTVATHPAVLFAWIAPEERIVGYIFRH